MKRRRVESHTTGSMSHDLKISMSMSMSDYIAHYCTRTVPLMPYRPIS